MKSIEQKTIGKFITADIVKQACTLATNGMDVEQMRRRIRVLDALDRAGEKDIVLEDADYSTLSDAINNTAWKFADKDLLSVIDGILKDAKTPEA